MKQASEIYENMLAVFREKTGKKEDSDISVRLFAAAAQLESLYGYCDWALKQSFPQTAVGEYLDLHAALRGLGRKEAKKAQGVLRFSLDAVRSDDVVVAEGTVCTDGTNRFVTLESGTIAAGDLFCEVKAEAEEADAAGNVPSGAVTRMPLAPTGIASCTNPVAFTGGAAEEDDDSLRQRILESFLRLPNGANAAFYAQRAGANPKVTGVQVLPRVRGAGTVDVVVAAEADEANVAAEVQADLASVREISVDVLVRVPEKRAVNPAVTVWPADGISGEEACTAAKAALERFFDGSLLGKPVYRAQLGGAVFATGKVKNYVLTAPTADMAAADGVLPVLGSVTVTEGI